MFHFVHNVFCLLTKWAKWWRETIKWKWSISFPRVSLAPRSLVVCQLKWSACSCSINRSTPKRYFTRNIIYIFFRAIIIFISFLLCLGRDQQHDTGAVESRAISEREWERERKSSVAEKVSFWIEKHIKFIEEKSDDLWSGIKGDTSAFLSF